MPFQKMLERKHFEKSLIKNRCDGVVTQRNGFA